MSTKQGRLTARQVSQSLIAIGASTALAGAVFWLPAQSANADPPGNNGTVKIAGQGDFDSIPNNTPHVGCGFQIEWYGFDEGADIISQVTFEMQAPTADVGLSGTSPGELFVGEDPAGGGTDLDAVQIYTLNFDGDPHPVQGYHVKLTIHTPGSIGADTKSKVFWVEDCTDEPTTSEPPTSEPPTSEPPTSEPPTSEPPTSEPPTSEPPSVTPSGSETATPSDEPSDEPSVEPSESENGDDDVNVAGEEATTVPTAVDAGLSGPTSPTGQSGSGSQLPLLLVLLGAGLAAAGSIGRAVTSGSDES